MMNCRGLTELVVLNIGLQLGVLSPTMFTMLVLMALLSTAMTVPLVRLLTPRRELAVAGDGPVQTVLPIDLEPAQDPRAA
jgi:K+:H+ antiporter